MTMFDKPTLTLQEAANLLGFKGVGRLRRKASEGQIPGAFKISNKWMFLTDELIQHVRTYNDRKHSQTEKTARNNQWQSLRKRTRPTITPSSCSTELELRKVLELPPQRKQKNMS